MTQKSEPGIPCWIYRSNRRDEMYLYLAREDDFEALPAELLNTFGTPERVMQITLHAGRTLAREDTLRVMERLTSNGYYIQMPPKWHPTLSEGEQTF